MSGAGAPSLSVDGSGLTVEIVASQWHTEVMDGLVAGAIRAAEAAGAAYRVTRVASTGGFLRRGNVTLLIGVEPAKVQGVLDLLRETCAPPEPGQHRATVFVVDAAHFEQV